MKKSKFLSIVAVAAAIITSFSLPLTAVAVSRTTTTEVLGISRLVEDAANPQVLGARRNNVSSDNVTVGDITDKVALAQLSDLELLAKLISDYTHKEVKASEISILDSMNVKADANTEVSVAKPLFLTFSFPSILNTTEAYVFHCGKNGWEIVPTTVAEGLVSGKFTSLSPVAIVVKTSTLKAQQKAQ